MVKFIRSEWNKYSRLGVRRRKKLKYRRARGGENKIRLKMKGHPRNVSIGFRSKKTKRDLIKGMMPITIYNLDELKKLEKHEIAVIGKIGNKKKKHIAEYAKQHNLSFLNLNPENFIKEIEEKMKLRKENKQKKTEAKKAKEKKKEKKEKKEEKQYKEEKLEEKTEEDKK